MKYIFFKIVGFPFRSGYLEFSHLTELKMIYITEFYMKKQYQSSKSNN